MQYLLVTANGNHMEFHTKAGAELYKTLYGGYIIKSSEQLALAA
jgi:hypothetical protein